MDEIKIPIEVDGGDAAVKTVKELHDLLVKIQGDATDVNREIKEINDTIKQDSDLLKPLQKAYEETSQRVNELTELRKRLNKGTDEERQRAQELGVQYKALTELREQQFEKIVAISVKIDENKQRVAELTQTYKAQLKETTALSGSYDQMNQVLGQLRDRYRQMSEAERESAAGRDLLKYIKQLDTELKSLDASMGNHQRNVGNYASATEGLSQVAGGVNRGMLALSGTLSTVGVEVDKNLTKIPLILTRILSGVKSLRKGLTQIVPATKAAGAAIQAMTVKAQALMATLTLGLSVAIGVIISQWDKISALWKDPAIDDAKQAIDDLTDAMERNADQVQVKNTAALAAYTEALRAAGGDIEAITTAQQQYNDALRQTALEEAKANKEAADRAVLLAADAKLHAKRKKAIKETTDAYNHALDSQRDANEKYAQAVNAIAKADADRLARKVQAEEDAAKKSKQIRDKANRELERQQEEEKRIREQGEKALAGILERLYKAKLSAQERELYDLSTQYFRELEIMNNYGDDIVGLAEYYEQRKLEIIEKYADEASRKRQENAQNAVDSEFDIIETTIKERQASSEDRNPLANLRDQITNIGEQLTALDAFHEKSMAIIDAELEQENLSAERRAELAQQKIDLDNQVSAKRQALWNDESRLREKLSKEEKQYYTQTAAQALTSVASLMGAMEGLFEEGSEEQKKMQIASAVVNGLAGVANAWAQALGSMPPPFSYIAGAISTASVIATTAAQIRKIKSNSDDVSGTGSAAAATPVVGTVLDTAALSSQLTNETEFDLEQARRDTRVYVVEEDITRTQDDVRVTVDESNF